MKGILNADVMWEIEDKKDRLRKNGEIRTVRLGVREWGKTTEIGFFDFSYATFGSWWAEILLWSAFTGICQNIYKLLKCNIMLEH